MLTDRKRQVRYGYHNDDFCLNKPESHRHLTSLELGVAGRCLSAGGRYACVGGACVDPSWLGAAWYLIGRLGKLPSGSACQRTSHSSEPAATSHF